MEDDLTSAIVEMPDAVVVCDDEGRIVLANGRVSCLLGHAADELIGLPLDALLPRGVAGLPRPSEGREVLARHRDGRAVWVELTAARLGDGELVVIDMRDA